MTCSQFLGTEVETYTQRNPFLNQIPDFYENPNLEAGIMAIRTARIKEKEEFKAGHPVNLMEIKFHFSNLMTVVRCIPKKKLNVKF